MFTGIIAKAASKIAGARSRCAYWAQTAGTIATAFAVMAPVLVGATGTALDLGQSFLVRQRLAGALDAAALAASASEHEEDAIEERIDQFMEANYPTGKIGNLLIESIDVSVDGDDITVTAQAEYETSFMRILGIDTLTVSAETTIHKSIKGLEAVLVMDNTGSMGEANMEHLRTAATNFVEIMFDRAAEPTDVKIGLVPYSSSVRIGHYGLGKVPNDTAFDAGGIGALATYGAGTVFVTVPTGVNYITYDDRDRAYDDERPDYDVTADDGWNGCIVEHEATNYNAAATHVFTNATAGTGSTAQQGGHAYGQLWSTSATAGACTTSSNCRGHGWDATITTNDPYPDDSTDTYTGPWDIYYYGDIVSSGNECDDISSSYSYTRCSACYKTGISGSDDRECFHNRCFCAHKTPNTGCPWAYIQPMISDEDQLYDVIDSMRHEGSTYSNLGMMWGLRLISPTAPFTEGAAFNDVNWKKAVIIMTDGEMSPSGTYSGYWDSSKVGSADSIDTLNTRLKEVCTYLKNNNVTIYAVNFKHATSDISETTKQVYKDCASDPDEEYYKFVTTGAELTSTFEEIAAALSRLHVSK